MGSQYFVAVSVSVVGARLLPGEESLWEWHGLCVVLGFLYLCLYMYVIDTVSVCHALGC